MSYDAQRLAGQRAFKLNQERVVPVSVSSFGKSMVDNDERAKQWLRGWDQAKLADQDIKTVGELHARLEAIMRETGRSDLPLNVSVFQETDNNPHGSYYEDRTISNYVAVQCKDGFEFVELCI